MNNPYPTLTFWLHILMVIAAICATAFPMLYAFSPWYRSVLGRALMIQGVALAWILDITAIYALIENEDLETKLWVYVVSFIFLACATAFMTMRLWQINYRIAQNQEKSLGRRHTDR